MKFPIIMSSNTRYLTAAMSDCRGASNVTPTPPLLAELMSTIVSTPPTRNLRYRM